MNGRGATSPDAVVVGGGVVGHACAMALQDRGAEVAIITDGPFSGSASWGNSGHIAIEQHIPLASLPMLRSLPRRLFAFGGPVALPPGEWARWLPFGWRLTRAALPARFARGRQALGALMALALPEWRRLAEMLGEPELLRVSGHLIVWVDRAERDAGVARSFADNAPGTSVTALTSDDIAGLGLPIGVTPAGGVRFAGTASIADPDRLGAALRARFLAQGGRYEVGRARLAVADRRCRVQLGERQIHADVIVLAAGIGSAAPMRAVGEPTPMIAERGYHLDLDPGEWPADAPPVVFEERALLLTRFSDRLRAASFTEFSSPEASPDPRKWRRLLQHLDALGIDPGASPRPWMGCRPTLPDYLPAIGRSGRASNLLYAFGHNHLGLTLAPVSGRIVAELAASVPPSIPLEPFSLTRFAGWRWSR